MPTYQIAKVGSFELPGGPGQGNGAGGAHGVKGTVASAGFGNGIAQPGNGDGRSNGRGSGQHRRIRRSPDRAEHRRQSRSARWRAALRLLQSRFCTSPTPNYTQEARALKLEGEVLIEVMFGADGHLQVNARSPRPRPWTRRVGRRSRQPDSLQARHAQWYPSGFNSGCARFVPTSVLRAKSLRKKERIESCVLEMDVHRFPAGRDERQPLKQGPSQLLHPPRLRNAAAAGPGNHS